MKENSKAGWLHYFMVAGNVVMKEDDDIHGVMVNAVVTTDEPLITVHVLGKAQQALQVNLFNKLGETKEVIDVIIVGIIRLGHMTPEMFNARPEGLVVQERAPIDSNDPYGEDPFASEIADRVLAS